MHIWVSFFLIASAAWGQTVTGSIVGTVADTSGSVIPGVEVRAVSQATGAARDAMTDAAGAFVVPALPPGVYTLTVEKQGFKKYERKEINLPANERLAVGELVLEVGALTETISVTARGAAVQTASSERSGILTSTQMTNLSVINRDFSSLVSLLPGVVASPRGETVGFGANSLLNVQGGRNTGNNITIDGVPTNDLGNAFSVTSFITMDAVSEVKILVSSFQAEFGRKPGASVQAVTKSGSQQFHANAYWYKRHEMFNANSFFNNRNGVPEAKYRYTTAGYNLGGPVTVPGKFNRNRDKVFFFWSQEFLREQRPQPIRQVTTPTVAERRGDFSDSRDTNGALIVVRDPLAGAAFAGNMVPASRINPNGRNYLNLLPEPNFFNIGLSSRRYNYQVQEALEAPKHTELLRTDFALTSKTTMYFRYNQWWEDVRGFAVPGGNANWGWIPSTYLNTAKTGLISLTKILGPRDVLEFSTGVNRGTENATAPETAINRVTRATANFNVPQFYPGNNPLNLVPRASFGGLSQPANPTVENRFPLRGTDTLYTLSTLLTRSQGAHTLKFGFWAEKAHNTEGEDGNYNGDFNFGRNVNNPLDTNHPYATALLGHFASYAESTTRPSESSRSNLLEWFAQDNWRAFSRLTVDAGVRFTWAQPYRSVYRAEAAFLPNLWDAAQATKLIEPFRQGNTRVGRHPGTGQILPAAAIGAMAAGIGNPLNGTIVVRDTPGYPGGLRDDSGVKVAPRLGLAWDPFGKGKTAVRMGAGVFFEGREQGNRGYGIWRNPPLRADPVIYYGTFDTLPQSRGVEFPAASGGFLRPWPMSRTYNANFGVQQDVGFGTVLDMSYVGAFGRRLSQMRNLNSIPFGTNFLASSRDTTLASGPLAPAFLRPYVGYNDINLYEFVGNSSYHSLQVTANRRFTQGLQFGGSWTWSKAMNYSDTNTAGVSNLIDPKVWNYGVAGFDRTHNLVVNWTWDVPRLSGGSGNAFVRQTLDGWQVSGIARFVSGDPLGVGLGFINAVDITGSPTDGARTVVVANPVLEKGERTFSRYFNTDAFRPPAVGTFGNAARTVIRGPGVNNWDVSFFKNFPVKEKVRLQFRGEFYNFFNKTQWAAVDTNARFDAQGRQANPRMGEITDARAPRRIQLALRLTF